MALSKIKTNSIADNAITSTKIGVDVIVAEDLANNSVTVAEIASNAVTTAKIADANVTTDKLATTLTVTHALGSASTPSITFTGDTNTGIFSPAADTLAFAEGGAEIARFDSSGNLGIGTTSPATKLELYSSQNANVELLRLNNPEANGLGTQIGFTQGSTTWSQIISEYSSGWRTKIGAGNPSGTSAGDAGYFTFVTNNGTAYAERMRIAANGNVGIGTTTPANKLEVSNGAADVAVLVKATGSNYATYRMQNTSRDYSMQIRTDQSNAWTLRDETGGANRLLITTGGDFLMTPDYRTAPRGRVDISAVGGTVGGLPSVCLAMSRWGDAGVMVNFFGDHNSTTSIGNITNAGGTNTQYNTSSDYRLKENIALMTGALAKVALLKPSTYKWKSTGAEGQGFIAHELQEVFPDAVCGEKDAVNGDGSIQSQSIDTSYLVATLTAAIQELKAEFDEYKRTHP
jgi:hypothetical protein